MEFKELNQKGYELRENEGKHAEALNVFKQALEVAEDFDQRSEAMSQLGLTHWHMKDFDAARKVWSENLTLCEKAGQPGPLALAYRNMGRPEITSDWEKQLEFMKNSFELAEKAGREDAVWFAHGVVAAAIKAEKLDVAKEWSEIEFVELQKHLEGTIEVPNQNNVHIWHTGYLMGVALIREDITKLEEAMVIAKKASLPKRIEQIKELMDGFEN